MLYVLLKSRRFSLDDLQRHVEGVGFVISIDLREKFHVISARLELVCVSSG